MLRDLRWALRWIARRPGLASVSVASLGLGIGANVAVFSVIDAFLFRPFPVSEPERLGVVMSRTAEGELRHVSVVHQFDYFLPRGPFGPGLRGFGAAASTRPTIHSAS